MQIANEKIVQIHYVLTDDEGTVIDRSEPETPLAYLHGSGNIIPGLEKALEGKREGDKVNVRVEPEDGYGARHDELVQAVPREAFGEIDQVEVGMRFEARTDTGAQRVVTVREITDETVTVDGNHPLAGQTLCFDVSVVEVRDATTDEVDHGHAHDRDAHD